jgi:hypothetical protein
MELARWMLGFHDARSYASVNLMFQDASLTRLIQARIGKRMSHLAEHNTVERVASEGRMLTRGLLLSSGSSARSRNSRKQRE